MRFCTKCGAQNADMAKVCQGCAQPLTQLAGKTCPAGRHTMDPSWTECVYCRQENVPTPVPPARVSTVMEGQLQPPRASVRNPTYKEGGPQPPRLVNAPPTPIAPPTPVSTPQPPRPRESTIYRPMGSTAAETAQPTPSMSRDRKIVGILVTYSWSPEGQIFPVREGRNFIGRDSECDICIPDDQTLSGKNSHITYRQNFVIGDMVSMTGTDVDGTPIEQQFHSLNNYATVRAGSTYFTFIAIQPPAA